jgi:hypothetical protein
LAGQRSQGAPICRGWDARAGSAEPAAGRPTGLLTIYSRQFFRPSSCENRRSPHIVALVRKRGALGDEAKGEGRNSLKLPPYVLSEMGGGRQEANASGYRHFETPRNSARDCSNARRATSASRSSGRKSSSTPHAAPSSAKPSTASSRTACRMYRALCDSRPRRASRTVC